jgi:P-type Cu2+ transporter
MKTLKKTIPVTGMHCAACALTVEKAIRGHKGVQQAAVNYANGQALIEYEVDTVDFAAIEKAVKGVGYGLINTDEEEKLKRLEAYERKRQRMLVINVTVALIFSPILFVMSMFQFHFPNAEYVQWALATPVVLFSGRQFFVNAVKQARYLMANMDTLVALSTGIAYCFSVFNVFNKSYWQEADVMPPLYFESAAVVISFLLLGKLLEQRAQTYTSSAIKKLINLTPDTVTRLAASGAEEVVSIKEIQIGDNIYIKPGERIPVDGFLSHGYSFVNESMLTGEPLAVEKTNGSKLYSGTVNQKGAFIMTAEKVGNDTLLAKIIQNVQEAQGSKAPAQKLADKVAGIFVPVVLGISVVTFVVWAYFGGPLGYLNGILCAITTLVIACPCALGLATPTAIIAGIGKAAENGILIKDAESLEQIRNIDTIVLDKTGTITEGLPKVMDIAWKSDADPELLASVLYSMELKSEHPLAQAIVDFFGGIGVTVVDVSSFTSITGSGVTATWQQNIYFAGSQKLLKSLNIAPPLELATKVAAWEDASYSVIWLANQSSALGAVAITDKIRPSAAYCIELLRQMNIDAWMITGDNQATAYTVAKEAGILNFTAEASPRDKYQLVADLRQQGKIVAMAGDGINDAEALAHADISIAMGTGSDIALDVAKITLMSADLKKIPLAILLSRMTVRTVRRNLFWAFFYNVVAIPIAAGALYPINGWLINPMIAGAAMALSSVSVVLSSLRLKTTNVSV